MFYSGLGTRNSPITIDDSEEEVQHGLCSNVSSTSRSPTPPHFAARRGTYLTELPPHCHPTGEAAQKLQKFKDDLQTQVQLKKRKRKKSMTQDESSPRRHKPCPPLEDSLTSVVENPVVQVQVPPQVEDKKSKKRRKKLERQAAKTEAYIQRNKPYEAKSHAEWFDKTHYSALSDDLPSEHTSSASTASASLGPLDRSTLSANIPLDSSSDARDSFNVSETPRTQTSQQLVLRRPSSSYTSEHSVSQMPTPWPQIMPMSSHTALQQYFPIGATMPLVEYNPLLQVLEQFSNAMHTVQSPSVALSTDFSPFLPSNFTSWDNVLSSLPSLSSQATDPTPRYRMTIGNEIRSYPSVHGLFNVSKFKDTITRVPEVNRTLIMEQLPKSHRNKDWITWWCQSVCNSVPLQIMIDSAKALVELENHELAQMVWNSPRLGMDSTGMKPLVAAKGQPREDQISVYWYRGDLEEGEVLEETLSKSQKKARLREDLAKLKEEQEKGAKGREQLHQQQSHIKPLRYGKIVIHQEQLQKATSSPLIHQTSTQALSAPLSLPQRPLTQSNAFPITKSSSIPQPLDTSTSSFEPLNVTMMGNTDSKSVHRQTHAPSFETNKHKADRSPSSHNSPSRHPALLPTPCAPLPPCPSSIAPFNLAATSVMTNGNTSLCDVRASTSSLASSEIATPRTLAPNQCDEQNTSDSPRPFSRLSSSSSLLGRTKEEHRSQSLKSPSSDPSLPADHRSTQGQEHPGKTDLRQKEEERHGSVGTPVEGKVVSSGSNCQETKVASAVEDTRPHGDVADRGVPLAPTLRVSNPPSSLFSQANPALSPALGITDNSARIKDFPLSIPSNKEDPTVSKTEVCVSHKKTRVSSHSISLNDMAVSFITQTLQQLKPQDEIEGSFTQTHVYARNGRPVAYSEQSKERTLSASTSSNASNLDSRLTHTVTKQWLLQRQDQLEKLIAESKLLMGKLAEAQTKQEKERIMAILREKNRSMDAVSNSIKNETLVSCGGNSESKGWLRMRWPESKEDAGVLIISDDEDDTP